MKIPAKTKKTPVIRGDGMDLEKVVKELEDTAEYFRYWQEVGNYGDQPVFREHEKHCNDAIAMMKELNDSKNSKGSDRLEVVRCKDCKYRFVDGDNVSFNICLLNHNKVQPDDWFCADGERENFRKPVSISATDYEGIDCE